MFPPMEFEGANYYLKAMNCPMHNLIFRSRGRSYRELPLRLFEFGSVYRYEKSGVIHGLTRVRGFAQDDSHSYVTPEQAPARSSTCWTSCSACSRDFGLDDYYLEMSTRDDANTDKFVGNDEDWARRPRSSRTWPPRPVSSSSPTRAGRRSTARRSRSRPATPSAGPGRCRPSSTTSTSPRVRPGVPGRRRHPAAAGHDPLGQVRLDRAVLRCARRALRRRVPSMARTGAGAGDPGRRRHNDYLDEVAEKLRARGFGSRSTTPTTGCRRRSATPSSRRCRSW